MPRTVRTTQVMTGIPLGIPAATPTSFEPPLAIGVVADTHVYRGGRRRLPSEVLELFRRLGVGLILHAGDVSSLEVIRALGAVAPTVAVRGNNEDAELQSVLAPIQRFTVGSFSFVLLHGHDDRTARRAARRYAGQVSCVVYGHSHIPKIELADGTILFNPGSPTDRRWQPHFGVGLIRMSGERIDPDLILFDDPRHLANLS